MSRFFLTSSIAARIPSAICVPPPISSMSISSIARLTASRLSRLFRRHDHFRLVGERDDRDFVLRGQVGGEKLYRLDYELEPLLVVHRARAIDHDAQVKRQPATTAATRAAGNSLEQDIEDKILRARQHVLAARERLEAYRFGHLVDLPPSIVSASIDCWQPILSLANQFLQTIRKSRAGGYDAGFRPFWPRDRLGYDPGSHQGPFANYTETVMSTDLRAKCAIAGLGQTRMGKNFYHPNAMGFAVEAIELALADAGLERSDLDGLLVNPGVTWMENAMASFSLQQAMGLTDLSLTATMNLGGATAAAMIMHATQAIEAGMANVVACVFADAPLRPPSPDKGKAAGSAAAYGFARGLNAYYGQFGVNAAYAFVAQRHMNVYGTGRSSSARSRSRSAIGPTSIPPRSSMTRR